MMFLKVHSFLYIFVFLQVPESSFIFASLYVCVTPCLSMIFYDCVTPCLSMKFLKSSFMFVSYYFCSQKYTPRIWTPTRATRSPLRPFSPWRNGAGSRSGAMTFPAWVPPRRLFRPRSTRRCFSIGAPRSRYDVSSGTLPPSPCTPSSGRPSRSSQRTRSRSAS